MTFVLAGSAMAAEHKTAATGKEVAQSDARTSNTTERVILVPVTGSWIPQRVVVMGGRQVNSASPLVVFQGNDLYRSGATTVSGILAQDPSITFRRR
jgi:hypothetical protein